MGKIEPVMKEKPIIFSIEMVRAILEGRKTQTRRVIKINGQAITHPEESIELHEEGAIYYSLNSMSGYYKPPYQIGNTLWVRETWRLSLAGGFYVYKADPGREARNKELCKIDPTLKWHSPRYMPREVARIFLKVTNVRVERLQDITEEDAIREGVHPWGLETQQRRDKWCRYTQITDPGRITGTFRGEFAAFWDSLNAKRGYSWETNPWVWVIEFKSIESKRKEGNKT